MGWQIFDYTKHNMPGFYKGSLLYLIILIPCFSIFSCKKKDVIPVSPPLPDSNNSPAPLIHYTQENSSLPSDTVYSFWIHNNALYAGTASGVYCVSDTNKFIYQPSLINTLSDKHIYSLLHINDTLWLATGKGLVCIAPDNSVFTYTAQNSPLLTNKVRTLEKGEADHLWIGTFSGGGVCLKSGDQWLSFTPGNSGLAANSVADILWQDSVVWIATAGGLCRYDMVNSWTVFHTGNSGIPNNWIYDIEKVQNKLWIATNGGIAVYNFLADQWQAWDASDLSINANFIRTIYSDILHNKVWAGTETNGVLYYDLSSFTWHKLGDMYPEIDFLSVSDIILYKNQIYIASKNKGIYLVPAF